MGWFWAETSSPVAPPALSGPATASPFASHPDHTSDATPPPGCPMHSRTVDVLSASSGAKRPSSPSHPLPSTSGCPVPHDQRGNMPNPHIQHPDVASPPKKQSSILSKLNPLNYMYSDLSQAAAPGQSYELPTERDPSSIPKGSGDGNWEYPSPQQMYNALLRKGYTDTDVTAVESMVAVHNFLNEGAWAEIVDWERRFGHGLARGWEISKKGEENSLAALTRIETAEGGPRQATLVRFQGRPRDMTPKAAMIQVMGWLYPSKFGTEPPFDRHDWYVSRDVNGQKKEVRYVIDYYSGPPEPTGEPVFYLDVRPAMTPTGAVERMMRWGGDVWWKASGGDAREGDRRSS